MEMYLAYYNDVSEHISSDIKQISPEPKSYIKPCNSIYDFTRRCLSEITKICKYIKKYDNRTLEMKIYQFHTDASCVYGELYLKTNNKEVLSERMAFITHCLIFALRSKGDYTYYSNDEYYEDFTVLYYSTIGIYHNSIDEFNKLYIEHLIDKDLINDREYMVNTCNKLRNIVQRMENIRHIYSDYAKRDICANSRDNDYMYFTNVHNERYSIHINCHPKITEFIHNVNKHPDELINRVKELEKKIEYTDEDKNKEDEKMHIINNRIRELRNITNFVCKLNDPQQDLHKLDLAANKTAKELMDRTT